MEFFHRSRGLCQGDPLSPFLFLIMAEAFGMLLDKAFHRGLLEGFRVGNEGLLVSYLRFADDTLIMCRASSTQMLYLYCVIQCFEAVSGLKVNVHKRRLFGIGNVDNLDGLATCLGCSVGYLSQSSSSGLLQEFYVLESCDFPNTKKVG